MRISVVIPTRNEKENISALIPQLPYDVVVVDDSDDGTAEVARNLGAKVVQGRRRGLGQAIIDGVNSSSGDVVVVMDGDLSHSPVYVPQLLKPILEHGYDLVIGSRYVKGGDYSDWSLGRKIKSIIGAKLMQLVTGVKDSNSGFFSFRKEIIKDVQLENRSWKILLEVLFKGHWIAKKEVPIKFIDRSRGLSKNNNKERVRHAVHLIRLMVDKWANFIKFVLVGGVGNIWHFGLLYVLTEYVGLWYGVSQIISIIVAMTNNYLINHLWTFRTNRDSNQNILKGWVKFVSQSAICDYGIALPITIILTSGFHVWYMLSSFIASGIAVFFKFIMVKKTIWGSKRTARDADYEWRAYFQGLPWQKRWKRIISELVKEFAEKDGSAGVILDCGCGCSPNGILINHDDYIGYDLNTAKISYMNAKRLMNCDFVSGGFEQIKYDILPESIDTVLFIEVIEHLDNIEEAREGLKVLCSKLKHGGKMIVATPNFGGFRGRWMDRLYGIFQKGAYKEEHKLKFSLGSLKGLCGEIGLKYIDSRIPSGADIVCLFEKYAEVQQ